MRAIPPRIPPKNPPQTDPNQAEPCKGSEPLLARRPYVLIKVKKYRVVGVAES